MHIDKYELYWIYAFTGILGVFLAALIAGAVVFGVRVPDSGEFVNPTRLDQTEFANPGIRDMGDNEYTVYMVGRMWAFQPATITVPLGAEVTFNVTASDITHGFMIEEHNVNFELVPGHVARARITFDRVGEFAYICHEFCGRGHHLMHGTIIVEDVEEVAQNQE